jgi:UDPglucose 6-dehydrogenase
MRLTIIGTGYVGLVSGACLADVGNEVWCVDKDVKKVEALKKNVIPIYEPGLESVVKRNIEENRLFFTTDLAHSLGSSEICFITVDTPPDGDGKADISNVLAVAEKLGGLIDSYKIVVTKSTVPVGTTYRVREIISGKLRGRGLDPEKLFDVASNPEFLKEGDAVNDFMKPDRVVVGVEKESVAYKLHELYSPFMRKSDRFLKMDITSAELAKYAANSMLATRISFMNEMARLCDKVGADIDSIRHVLGSDPRIGPDFLYAGLGYGGSCFPKDMKALIQLGREYKIPLSIVESSHDANEKQRSWFWEKVTRHFNGEKNLAGKKIAVWGVAFKANTDDIRFAPSVDLISRLLDGGSKVFVCDPAAEENGKAVFGGRVIWCKGQYDCLTDADALIVCTEWREFRSPDFNRIKSLMKTPVIFDGRNLYDPSMLRDRGFTYISVGRI